MARHRSLLAGLVLLAGCTDRYGGSACRLTHEGGGATAQFHLDADCFANPFPTDLLRDGDEIAVPASRFGYLLPQTEAFDDTHEYLEEVAESLDGDGFSTIAPIRILFDHAVDLATVPGNVRLYVFDTAGRAVPDGTELVPTWDDDLSALLLQPQTPLRAKTTYGVAVLSTLLDGEGRPTMPTKDFGRYLAGGPLATDALVVEAASEVGAVVLAFSFRTQTETDDLVSIRDQVFGELGNVLLPDFDADTGFEGLLGGIYTNGSLGFSTILEGEDGSNLGTIATGIFESFDFRGLDEGSFDPELVAGRATPPTNPVDFRVAVPAGSAPSGGWPIVLYQHGLGGSSQDVYRWANELATYGFATVAISALEHGRRGTVTEFFQWGSIPATRDNIRQTNADQLQLLRTLRNGKVFGTDPLFDLLDTSDVRYFGISLGGILGVNFLAVAPGLDLGALVVPGAHLSLELYAEQVGVEYLYPFISARAGIDPEDPEFDDFIKGFQPLVQLGIDRGDPANYAPHVVTEGQQLPNTGAKIVLQTEAPGDTWVPNDANETLRRAMGLPLLTAAVTNTAGVSGTWVFDVEAFDYEDEPHGYFGDLCEGRHQVFHWLATDGQELVDPAVAGCPQ